MVFWTLLTNQNFLHKRLSPTQDLPVSTFVLFLILSNVVDLIIFLSTEVKAFMASVIIYNMYQGVIYYSLHVHV